MTYTILKHYGGNPVVDQTQWDGLAERKVAMDKLSAFYDYVERLPDQIEQALNSMHARMDALSVDEGLARRLYEYVETHHQEILAEWLDVAAAEVFIGEEKKSG